MYDVIVVGGGPSGSRVAAGLTGGGFSVLVLEGKKAISGKTSCTGIVSRECVEAFGIEESAILRKVSSARLFSPCGKELHLRRDETQACVLDRAGFDIAMAQRALDAGAEYSFGSRVVDYKVYANQVVTTFYRDRQEEQLPARCIVIAGGFSTRSLGGELPDCVLGAQAEVDAPGLDEVEVYFGDMAPGFFAWLVPVTMGKARTGLLTRRRYPADLTAVGRLNSWLKQLKSRGKIASARVKISTGTIPIKPPARTYSDRLLLVGDAAGQVKPTTGGGIYYGLFGADIAAATLRRALEEDDLSAGRLARYERAWRKKLGGELRTGYWARRLFERLSSRQIDRLFDAIEAGGIGEALLGAPELSFDWHGRTIVSLLKYRMVAGVLNIVRPPFTRSRKD